MTKITPKAADAFENSFILKRIDLGWKRLEQITSHINTEVEESKKEYKEQLDFSPLSEEEKNYEDEHAKYLLSLPGGKGSKGI